MLKNYTSSVPASWKILQDWVEAQMAMIELAQIEVMEVFLPYLYDGQKKQTFFEQIKSKGFQKLLPKPEGAK